MLYFITDNNSFFVKKVFYFGVISMSRIKQNINWTYLDDYRGKVFTGEWPTFPELWQIQVQRFPVAFLRMTMKRAMLLKMMADKGSVLPEKTVQAMNLKKTKDHGYSLQAIAMGMGMEGEPWQKQVREAIKKNPFLENLKKK